MTAQRRLQIILILLAMVTLIGTVGYKIVGQLEGEDWSVLDCLYMTIITLTTVGYREAVPINTALTKIFTMALLIIGCGVILYGLSTATALFVEGELTNIVWRRKMEKRADDLRDHTIICGAGSTGIHVIEEMVRIGRPIAVVEKNEFVAKHAEEVGATCVICGDAMDDHVLIEAGIERAQGLVTTLPEDKDNLYLTFSARQLNPRLRIVARVTNPDMRQKLLRAGANAVVSPNQIGGLRMASELVRPEVVSFFDEMVRDKRSTYRMEQITVSDRADFANKKLSDSRITERTGLLVVALRRPNETNFIYNPKGGEMVTPGSTLVVIGDVKTIEQLRQIAEPS